ncbi:MAG: GAF domain-containing protein [Streptosporangiales bacterium]|nr:GAF domain-containing protein [Streptosporangiales bacterium]
MNTSAEPWPTGPAADQQRIRQAKDDLLSNGLLAVRPSAVGVRDVIERSWRRSLGDTVPTRPDEIPYQEIDGHELELGRAAATVFDRLSDHIGEVRVAMFLSDHTGKIIMRRVSEPSQRSVLDNAFAAEGFDFSETSIGTNGLGTVIAERRPLVVRGSEHYNDMLEPITCAGTPVFEPFTGRLVGTFSLACYTVDATPLTYAVAIDVGRQIESNLTAMRGAKERALIQAYLVANQGEHDPVLVVNERVMFANTAGLTYVSSDSHALLWTHLSDAPLERGPQRIGIPLPTAWREAVVERVDGSHESDAAYCVRLLPADHDPPHRAGTVLTGSAIRLPAASLSVTPDVQTQLIDAICSRDCVAIDGGPGTGKFHAASAVYRTFRTHVSPLVIDVSCHRRDDESGWFSAASEALAEDRPVILRHVQDLEPREVNRVKALVQCQDSAGSTATAGDRCAALVMTVDLDAAEEHVQSLVGQLATIVRLPTLREIQQQIPQLVGHILTGLPDGRRETTFSSEALQALIAWSWPGNVAELSRTVEDLACRMPGGVVRLTDLPTRLQHARSRRQLTLMEDAERQAIISALHRSGGNRTEAAQALGIGRTTLYRKMVALRIDA